jgi:SH3-like domain-containing protein
VTVRARRLAPLVAAALAATPALALDYLSVAEAAPMYDAPSQKANKRFAVAAGTPVEAIVTLDAWVKVRDSRGDLAWMEKRHLIAKRTLIVRSERAEIRVQPDEKSALAFEAAKDVVLDWVEPGPAGWVRVRHRDGQSGFVRTVQVWGS